jgi:hypothetical protein
MELVWLDYLVASWVAGWLAVWLTSCITHAVPTLASWNDALYLRGRSLKPTSYSGVHIPYTQDVCLPVALKTGAAFPPPYTFASINCRSHLAVNGKNWSLGCRLHSLRTCLATCWNYVALMQRLSGHSETIQRNPLSLLWSRRNIYRCGYKWPLLEPWAIWVQFPIVTNFFSDFTFWYIPVPSDGGCSLRLVLSKSHCQKWD